MVLRSAAPGSLATTILMPQDRIPREPLAPWARRLAVRLETGRKTIRSTRELCGELASIGNNAALIAASRGEMRVAWRLTERQIWWQGRMARRSADAAVNALALQPWVNLGRLEALTGRWREALARFANLASYELTDRLEIGCVRLGDSAWTAVMPSREQFLDFLESVRVFDSLRAMLLNRRFELVHPFAASFAHRGGLRWVGEEACVVAECGVGDHAAAAARARAAAREARGWHRAVLRLRAAEAHACAGELDQAVTILAQLAGVVCQLSPMALASPQHMPATARLAGACHEAGLGDEACAVARAVLEGARAANDEPIQIEMLRLLTAAAPREEVPHWSDALRTAEEATEYARFRRGGPPPPGGVVTELYDRLEEVYAS